jgi:hypothetical protein
MSPGGLGSGGTGCRSQGWDVEDQDLALARAADTEERIPAVASNIEARAARGLLKGYPGSDLPEGPDDALPTVHGATLTSPSDTAVSRQISIRSNQLSIPLAL